MSSIAKSLQAMALQPLRWFAANAIFANLSNGLTYITMTWILLNSKNSITALATLMICFWAPTVFLGPLCGVIADRYPKKWLLIFSNGLRGIMLLLIVIMVPRELDSTEIFAIALALSILGNFYGPASFAYIREIAPPNQMLHVNAIVAMAYEIGNIVGMGSAGLLVALHSSRGAIALSGLLFLIATSCLFLMKPDKNLGLAVKSKKLYGGLLANIHEGVNYLINQKNLRVLYTVQLLLMVNFLTAPILLAPFAKNLLHTSSSGFGMIQASLSAGVIIGGIVGPLLVEVWSLRQVVLAQTLGVTLLFLLFSFTHHLLMAQIIYFFLGICLASWTLIITKAQFYTDINFQARVQAGFNSLAAVCILSLYLLLNFAGDTIPLRLLYALEAVFTGTALHLLWRNRKIL